MENNKQVKWVDLSFKDKAAYCTAIASFVLGWILLFVALMLPPTGELSAGALTAFGTALVYSGSIFGVALYVKNSKAEVYADVMEHVERTIEKRMKKNAD